MNKSYADMSNFKVQKILDNTIIYPAKETISKVLNRFRSNYIASKIFSQAKEGEGTVFWIGGYELTDSEIEKGFKGNFCDITIKQIDYNAFIFHGTKLEIPLKNHPIKHLTNKPHPNYGHILLRKAISGYQYKTKEFAQEALKRFCLAFPQSAIIATLDKCYVQVFKRADNGKACVEKVTLIIVPSGDMFSISLMKSIRNGKMERPKILDFNDTVSAYFIDHTSSPESVFNDASLPVFIDY